MITLKKLFTLGLMNEVAPGLDEIALTPYYSYYCKSNKCCQHEVVNKGGSITYKYKSKVYKFMSNNRHHTCSDCGDGLFKIISRDR